jgi:cell division protein FtsQ
MAILGYAAARETSMFALESIEVRGAPADASRDVQQALAEFDGMSLVKINAADVEERLRDLPSVIDARVDRSFPHTVRVDVDAEQPLAIVGDRSNAWVVSLRGRVIGAADARTIARLPRVRLRSGSEVRLTPGDRVVGADTLARLAVLAEVPADFPLRVREARGGADGVTLVLARRVELRLGTNDDLTAKLASARAALAALSREERRGLAYLDVSLPQRPVGLQKSQLEGES